MVSKKSFPTQRITKGFTLNRRSRPLLLLPAVLVVSTLAFFYFSRPAAAVNRTRAGGGAPNKWSEAVKGTEVSAAVCTPPPAGMVNWWPGDGNANDIQGADHGTLQNGAAFAAGMVGQAFSFDGVDDFASFGAAAGNFGTADFTIDFWIKTSSTRLEGIVGKRIDCNPGSFWDIDLFNGRPGILLDQDASGTNFGGVRSNTPVNDGNFHHVAASRQGNTLSIYIDGVLDATSTTPGVTNIVNSVNLIAGRTACTGLDGTFSFTGLLDEIEIFNRALAPNEIQAIVNAGSAGKCRTSISPPSGLVGWWAGDGDPTDISGNTNHGSLQGGAGFVIGRVGQGFSFNGGTDSITIPDSPVLDLLSAGTMETWIFLNDINDSSIIEKGDFFTNDASYTLELRTGILRFDLYKGDGSLMEIFAGTDAVPLVGSWNHIAATWDTANLRLYVNGVQTVVQPYSFLRQDTAHPLIFGDGPTAQFAFVGRLDEVSLYSRALSQSEIQSIFNAGINGKTKSVTTSTGTNVSNLVNDATITFPSVTAAGTTTDITIDPATAGTLPPTFSQTGLAYEISTTASVSGNINVRFHLPCFTDSTQFSHLKVLHNEGGVLVDRTVGQDFASRTLAASVSFLSPFVIANGDQPTAAPATISGQVTTPDGSPLAGVVMRLGGQQSAMKITRRDGRYHFDNIDTDNFYIVTPSLANYQFSPSSRSFSLVGNKTDAVFTANPDAVVSANAIDTPEYFVRQQYIDILGREPDEAGLNYWSDKILACNGDVDCTRAQRTGVAAAFFIEQEFRQSGAFIYNLYEGALGRRPVYAEYSADRKNVVGGPSLEAQKQAFTAAFVARAEFASRYESSTTAASFVDALLANVQQASGVDLSSGRGSLISRYNTGANQTESRSFVLRDVTESAAVRDANYNAAFVLVEYFGYLHRNPDQRGYDFWLNVLNESGRNGNPANYRGMVCSFITSMEYQRRFSVVVSHSNSECGP